MENNHEVMVRTDGTAAEFPYKASAAQKNGTFDTQEFERLYELRWQAIIKLVYILDEHKKKFYHPQLFERIWQQKLAFILTATSKEEMKDILRPKLPRYNGAACVPSKYLCPEEELLMLTEATMRKPLNDAASKRFAELFELIYGKHIEELCA